MPYTKQADYTFAHAGRSAARLGIPTIIDAQGITFDLSGEPAITEGSCFCSTPLSARSYLRSCRLIIGTRKEHHETAYQARA